MNNQLDKIARGNVFSSNLFGKGQTLLSRYVKFNNSGYVRRTCLQYFGEAGLNMCNKKDQFCNLCCSYNVGTQHADKLYDCKSKCTKLVTGIESGLEKSNILKNQ